MAETMRAQVFRAPGRMGLEEVPVPTVSDVEVLVRVKRCGVCGSDVAYYEGATPLGTPSGRGPLVLGHEFTGEVVEVGAVPRSLGLVAPGDRVVVDPVQSCHACDFCAGGHPHMCPRAVISGVSRDGGLAEYALAHYTTLCRVPEGVGDTAAAFVEPLACVVHGLEKLAIRSGQFVAIFGPGPMGLLMVQWARATGAGKVALIGTRDARLAVGARCGADHLFNVRDPASPHFVRDLRAAIAEVTRGVLADRAIVATADGAAFRHALEVTGKLAIVVYFGLPGPDQMLTLPALPCKAMEKEIRFARMAPLAWPTAIRAMADRLVDVEPLLTGVVPLERGADAIRMVRDRADGTLKVQVAP